MTDDKQETNLAAVRSAISVTVFLPAGRRDRADRGWDSQIHARIVAVSWDDGSITLGPSPCHWPLIIGERVKLGKAGRLQVTESLIEDD